MSQLLKPISVKGVEKALSQLALGTAHFKADEKDHWFDMLDRFFSLGGNVIDTGRVYGDSEVVLGEWLDQRGLYDRICLITKGGGSSAGTVLPVDDFEAVIDGELDESLRSLRTETVDMYLLHRDNPVLGVDRIVSYLNRHLDRGRFQAFGVSNWSYGRINSACEYAEKHDLRPPAVVSNHLTLAMPTGDFWPGLDYVDDDGKRWHRATGIPLFAWSSQARGFFTGRYTPEAVEKDHRTDDEFSQKMLKVYASDENLAKLRRAERLAGEKGDFSAIDIALAWACGQDFPIVPVVGPRNLQELEGCVRAAGIRLTGEEMEWLDRVDRGVR